MQLVSRRPSEAQPARMEPLAKLPVFLDLAGKRAVVAGGGAPAAWKAELLAAAGADVDIYAASPGEEMRALLERGAAAGSLTLNERPWSVDILQPAAIALCEPASDAEARAFHCAARAAGVPVNVIDTPAYCQFQFGAIVNRSPVVVGISTDGAAPILGQAVRRRIETLLPPALAKWAALARDIRETVMTRLSPGAQRRAFWESFAERAFGPAPTHRDGKAAEGLIDEIAAGTSQKAGRVTLVGAGPGDAELLTMKAVRALQSADVILFDDLVSPDVLELARREARRMMVGKRGGRSSCRQDDINELMIKLALQGRHVVRLKCGDPMIFGRAGEEIEALSRHGIPVSVVPGITSASAMAAALGVSLTHRATSHSVRFVTGHSRAGGLPEDLDWRGLADPATTLIVYMGGRTASAFAARLMREGLSPGMAVAAMTSLSRDGSRRQHLTLADLAAGGLTLSPDDGPLLIGIGAVFEQAGVKSAQTEASERGRGDAVPTGQMPALMSG